MNLYERLVKEAKIAKRRGWSAPYNDAARGWTSGWKALTPKDAHLQLMRESAC